MEGHFAISSCIDINIYTYLYLDLSIYLSRSRSIYIYIYIYRYICIYTYIHIHIHIYTHTHICIYIYIYIHMCVCVCVFLLFILLFLFIQYTHHFTFPNNWKLINSSCDQNLKSILKKKRTSSALILRPIRWDTELSKIKIYLIVPYSTVPSGGG